jgi:hypothetical protein
MSTGKVEPRVIRRPKSRANARLMNLIKRAMRLDASKKQMVLDAMEYSVHAAMAGKSTQEILEGIRSLLNGKARN